MEDCERGVPEVLSPAPLIEVEYPRQLDAAANSIGSIQINFAIMILYCCCLDVDDDTDSHPSSSPSCFGSFIFIMKVSARDRRINGVVADLRGEEWINCCDIRINVTANYLLRNCHAIVDALPDVLPPFGHAIVVINHGAVISYVGEINEDNVFAGVHI